MTEPTPSQAPAPSDADSDISTAAFTTILLAGGLFFVRWFYMIMLSPYQLAADEAHYWEWSRHLALSYHTKGPGIAWTIALSTGVFGDFEWAIRLPAAASLMVMMFASAYLARALQSPPADATQRPDAAPVYGAVLIALMPAYWALGQFMTIDPPFLACWLLAAAVSLRLFRKWREGEGATLLCAGLGLLLGVGFLYKYTILLLLPGLIVYPIVNRRSLHLHAGMLVGLVLALVAFAAAISPVIIWNVREGWPTVAHLLGHLNVQGGDIAPEPVPLGKRVMWPVEMLGGQIGIVGPPMLAILILGLRGWRKSRAANTDAPGTEAADSAPALAPDASLMLYLGLPILVFYAAVSLKTDIEANWPLPAYLTLIPLAAAQLPAQLAHYRQKVQTWLAITEQPRPRQGWTRRRPETGWQLAWHWTLGWGIVAGVGILIGGYALQLPTIDRTPALKRGLQRVSGHRAFALEIHRLVQLQTFSQAQLPALTAPGPDSPDDAPPQADMDEAFERARQLAEQHLANPTSDLGLPPGMVSRVEAPLIITSHYGKAGLLAFYMPGHPRIFCAGHYLGDRETPYDAFADTDLTAPDLLGRSAILIGTRPHRWEKALRFDDIRPVEGMDQVYLATNYKGPAGTEEAE